LTLLDCLPVEKERAWASQCQEEHDKVRQAINAMLLLVHYKLVI
jgi:hypothetical protein